MGLTVSRLLRLFYARKEMRILMVGLDAAGKTTILYKLKLGEIVTTIPTIGSNLSPYFSMRSLIVYKQFLALSAFNILNFGSSAWCYLNSY